MYPFVLSEAVVEKLGFVHEHQAVEHPLARAPTAEHDRRALQLLDRSAEPVRGRYPRCGVLVTDIHDRQRHIFGGLIRFEDPDFRPFDEIRVVRVHAELYRGDMRLEIDDP